MLQRLDGVTLQFTLTVNEKEGIPPVQTFVSILRKKCLNVLDGTKGRCHPITVNKSVEGFHVEVSGTNI